MRWNYRVKPVKLSSVDVDDEAMKLESHLVFSLVVVHPVINPEIKRGPVALCATGPFYFSILILIEVIFIGSDEFARRISLPFLETKISRPFGVTVSCCHTFFPLMKIHAEDKLPSSIIIFSPSLRKGIFLENNAR